MNVPFRKLPGRFLVLPLVILLASLVPGGCYQDYNLGVQDFDAYLTKYAPETNFQGFKYFVMPDTVIHLIDKNAVVDPIAGFRKYDKQVLSLTASNFEARGYTRLPDTAAIGSSGIDRNTVFIALISQFSADYTGYYYDYWYGYWGGYYPGYPYYPPAYVSSYEYTVGTNLTEMVDYGKSTTQKKIVPVWVGVVSGLAGDPATVAQRLSTGINAQFEQSPYIYTSQ